MVEVPFKREKDRRKFEKQQAAFDDEIQRHADKNPSRVSPEMVIAIKDLLEGDRELQSDVVAAQLGDLLVDGRLAVLEDDMRGDSEEVELLRNPRVAHMIREAAYLGSSWQQGLAMGLAMPGAEWPLGHTPPDWVAGVLANSEMQQRNANLVEHNPQLDWTEHERLMSIVYGGVQALRDRYWGMPVDDKQDGEEG